MSTSAAAQQQPQLQQQQQFQQQLSPQAMSPQGALSPMSPQVVTAMAPAAAPLQQQQQQQQVPQMVASPTHQMPVHQAAAGRDEILDMVRSTTASSKREVESLAERVLTTAKEENTKIRNEMKTYLQETISTIRQDRDLEREREKCDRDRDREREKLEREKQAMQQQMEIHSLALQQQQQQQLSQQRTARAAFGGDGAGAAAAASVLGGGVAGGLSPVAAAATQQQHQQQSHLAHERDEAAKLATNAEVLAERRKGLLEVKEVEMQRLRQELHRVEADLHGALRRGAGLEADVARLEGAARTAKEEEERLRRQRAAADADAETHRKKAVEAGVECAALRERLAAEERAGRAAQEELRGLLREMTLKLEQRESRLTTAQEQLHAKTQESSTSSMRFEAEMKEYLSRPKRGEHEDALRRKSELQASLDAAALRLEEAEAEVATIRSLFRPYFPASTQLLLNQGPADPVALSARLKDLLAGRLLGADPSLLAASELHQALSGGLPVGVKPQDPLAALLLRQLVGGASAAAPLQQAAVAAAVQQQQQQQQSSLLVDLVKAMADKKETNLLEESAAAQKVILAKLVADASSGGGGSGGGGVGDDALLAVVSLLGGGGSGGGGGGVGGSNATQLSVLAVHVQQMRGELDQKRRRVDELEETATSLRQQLAKQERAGEEREAAAAKRARDQAAENEFLSGKNDRLRAELQQVGGELRTRRHGCGRRRRSARRRGSGRRTCSTRWTPCPRRRCVWWSSCGPRRSCRRSCCGS